MVNATYEILELRVLIKPQFSELYVRTGAASDGTLGVAGWWKKLIPPEEAALDYLMQSVDSGDYLLWDRGIPPSRLQNEE